MSSETIFILLFVVASAVALAARWLRIPYTVGLVLAGLALGGLRVLEPPHLTQDLLFSLFLPGLLFEAAFHLDFHDFRRNARAIVSLAVPGVLAATVLTTLVLTPLAGVLHFGEGFTWRHALVFGALISATDPVAVVALLRSLEAPRRLAVLLEGESLFNDGTAIVFFTLALEVLRGREVSASWVVLDFVRTVGLGAGIGVLIGLVVSHVLRPVDDPMVEITLTTVAAYGSFVTAEHLAASGVIATVAAGMLCGNFGARTGMSPSTRVAAETFWDYLAFALNSLVFLLIGFEFRMGRLLLSWKAILVAYLVVTLARAAVVAAVTALLRPSRERIPLAWSAVLTWGGIRAGLPMVLVLGLSRRMPQRDLLVAMTFGVVILSILVHGPTTSSLMRWLGVVRGHAERIRYEAARGRLQAALAALDEIGRMSDGRFAGEEVLPRLRQEYEDRAREAQGEIREVHLEAAEILEEELRAARRHLLTVERDEAMAAHRRGTLGRDAYEEVLADVDARRIGMESGQAREGRERDPRDPEEEGKGNKGEPPEVC